MDTLAVNTLSIDPGNQHRAAFIYYTDSVNLLLLLRLLHKAIKWLFLACHPSKPCRILVHALVSL